MSLEWDHVILFQYDLIILLLNLAMMSCMCGIGYVSNFVTELKALLSKIILPSATVFTIPNPGLSSSCWRNLILVDQIFICVAVLTTLG